MAEGYSLRDVDRMLGLRRSVVMGLVASGFIKPVRGPRREYRFSFQDLVILRAAHSLAQANISPSRILRSLRALRTRLPDGLPLTGLSIRAVGSSVVVREEGAAWTTDEGQYVLQFDVIPRGTGVEFLSPPPATDIAPVNWLKVAASLEQDAPDEACKAYRNAIQAGPCNPDAYVNLGCLLHRLGKLHEARDTYRLALQHCGAEPTLLFNFAVVEEDLGENDQAVRRYLEALALRDDLADAHFNLARLFESSGSHKEALRHWSAYRKLASRST